MMRISQNKDKPDLLILKCKLCVYVFLNRINFLEKPSLPMTKQCSESTVHFSVYLGARVIYEMFFCWFGGTGNVSR